MDIDQFNSIGDMDEERQNKIINEAMDEQKQANFYRKMRSKIQKYVDSHPNSKYINYLVAAPDFFDMMCELLADSRVPIKNKAYIAAAVLYFVSPIDIITDFLPVGFADDVCIAIFVIKSLLNSVDESIVKEHWAGDGDVIEKLEQLLNLADTVFEKGILKK